MASEERFSKEWQIYNEILPEYEGQFLSWVKPLKESDFKNRTTLDAGCGNGRNSFWPIKYGAKSVYAFDNNRETVEVAKKNLKMFKNATCFEGSIYEIPFKNKFDLVFSIGVVHHLANPGKAVRQLVKATKVGGKVLIWVYGYEGNELTIMVVNSLRIVTKQLPPEIVRALAFLPALLIYCYTRIFQPEHRYMKSLRMLSLRNIHSIVFDQMLPQIARYYRKDEARDLLSIEGVRNIQVTRVNDNSWSVLGIKKGI